MYDMIEEFNFVYENKIWGMTVVLCIVEVVEVDQNGVLSYMNIFYLCKHL